MIIVAVTNVSNNDNQLIIKKKNLNTIITKLNQFFCIINNLINNCSITNAVLNAPDYGHVVTIRIILM